MPLSQREPPIELDAKPHEDCARAFPWVAESPSGL